jgi:hypothetical protein
MYKNRIACISFIGFFLVLSPISNKLINNFPKVAFSIFKVKDDYNTQDWRKNLLDPGASHLSS